MIFPPNSTFPSLKLNPARSLPATIIGLSPFLEFPVPLVGVELIEPLAPLSISVFLSSLEAGSVLEALDPDPPFAELADEVPEEEPLSVLLPELVLVPVPVDPDPPVFEPEFVPEPGADPPFTDG